MFFCYDKPTIKYISCIFIKVTRPILLYYYTTTAAAAVVVAAVAATAANNTNNYYNNYNNNNDNSNNNHPLCQLLMCTLTLGKTDRCSGNVEFAYSSITFR